MLISMIDLADILSRFPVFSSLHRQELDELSALSFLWEYKKGQIVYRENSSSDHLYLVISGRIKTYTESSAREGKILEYLYRGTCFGIISLLTNQPHSVTAEAANDSLIIKIPSDKFSDFLNKNPLLAVEFSKMLSRRVKKEADREKNIFESLIVSVFSPKRKMGNTSYSLVLAKALHEESRKKVIAIEVKSSKEGFFISTPDKVLDLRKFSESYFEKCKEARFGFDALSLYYKNDSADELKTIPLFLSFLTQMYNFIILDLPSNQDSIVSMLLVQADAIHLIEGKSPFYLGKIEETIDSLKNSYLIKEDKFKVIVTGVPAKAAREAIYFVKSALSLHPHQTKSIFATLARFEEKNTARVIETYPATYYAKTLRRIAREISGVRVGLALGSGAAFGFAHVGVLKAIEENNLDIDIVSGSSVGSIIAALWGLGYNWKEIRERVRRFKNFPVFSFLDIGFFKKSFLKGRVFKGILRDLFGNKLMYELKRPVLLASFDFLKREAHVFSNDKSTILDAVMASCSIPGIFEPLEGKETLFFDGGILNPLPVGFLVSSGVKKIISVNVTPSKEETRKMYEESKNEPKLNVLDYIFGSIEAMQLKFIQESSSLSDVIIHPEFKNATWTEFKKIDYFIEEGERAALKQIDQIKRLEES